MQGRRPSFGVGLHASYEAELPQALQAVADGPFGNGEEALELLGGDDSVLGEEGDDIVIYIREEMK